MEKKKKLKKLVLRKEEVVNLNDYEMNAQKGGTAAVLSRISVVVSTILLRTCAPYDSGPGDCEPYDCEPYDCEPYNGGGG